MLAPNRVYFPRAFLHEKCECDMHSPNITGETPLQAALKGGHSAAANYIASLYGTLVGPIQNGDIACVLHMNSSMKFDANYIDEDGWPVVVHAANTKNLQCVKTLHENESNMNACVTGTGQGLTASHVAAANGSLDIIQFLHDVCSCDLDLKSADGVTPLHCAAGAGHLRIVQYLHDPCGCDMSARNSDGHSPLRLAHMNGHTDVVEFLISPGVGAWMLGLPLRCLAVLPLTFSALFCAPSCFEQPSLSMAPLLKLWSTTTLFAFATWLEPRAVTRTRRMGMVRRLLAWQSTTNIWTA